MRDLPPAVVAALARMQQAQRKVEANRLSVTVKKEAKAKLVPKRKAPEPSPMRKLASESDRWVYEALVLPIARVTCQCGAVQEVCGGKLLLARRDKRTGAIWESWEGATCALPPLPRRRRVHETTCEACPKCFSGLANLEHVAVLVPVPEEPVPVFDTPSAYEAAAKIAKLRKPAAEETHNISLEDL